eukprot:2517874-Rhodomonas_salina.1
MTARDRYQSMDRLNTVRENDSYPGVDQYSPSDRNATCPSQASVGLSIGGRDSRSECSEVEKMRTAMRYLE